MIRTRSIIAACLSATPLLTLAQTPDEFLHGRVYELRRETSAPSCHEWASGLPNGVWGNAGDYGQKTATLTDNGKVLIASAIYKPTGEKISHHFYKSRASCQAELSGRPAAPPAGKTMPASARTEPDMETPSYVDRLQRDFGKRIHYDSPKAAELVRKINIDCGARDGRYLPLHNALLARLNAASEPDAWMETRVADMGNGIRVYDSVHLNDGKELTPRLTMEINEWGGVKTYGVRPKALSDACFGSYGPIWKL